MLIESLGLAFRSCVVSCCCEAFLIDERAHRSKDFANEFATIVSEYVRSDAMRNEPMIKKEISNMRNCCRGDRNSLSQLGIPVSIDMYVLVMLCYFCKQSHNFHFEEVW